MENADKALATGSKRVYDVPPSALFAELSELAHFPYMAEGTFHLF